MIAKKKENLTEDEAKSKEKKKLLNRKLMCFLKILNCFDTLKEIPDESYFYSETLTFLRSNNEELQKLALQIIPIFQNHNVNNFLPLLKKLHTVKFHLFQLYKEKLLLERNF